MAKLGSYIDVRTLASLAAEGTISYAHGLGSAPDMVILQNLGTRSSNASAYMLNVTYDGTNVTIQNSGAGASSQIKAMALVAHSIIR